MHFTFEYIKQQYQAAIDAGYTFITCEEYTRFKKNPVNKKVIVNRVDIDYSVKKAGTLVDIFNELKIPTTFFLRLHAPEYNPFSFENYRIIKHLVDSGHELGYHSEIIDLAEIWKEDPGECLRRDIGVIHKMFNYKTRGVASHGGLTGLNNLDFWNERSAEDFDLLYETYDKTDTFGLFYDSLYISDSEWTKWKCYNKGKKMENDHRSIAEHVLDNHPLIHILIHPDTYYHTHMYDNEK